jgi:alpha-tubulin suppressor-like RCC1 family protein
MKREFFTENISNETMIKLTDELLRYEKTAKQRDRRGLLLKAIPAVAIFFLVIGLANISVILPALTGGGTGDGLTPATGVVTVSTGERVDGELTIIPRVVEKYVFEDLVKLIPEGRSLATFNAYYNIRDITDPALTDDDRVQLFSAFPMLEQNRIVFYLLDPNASDREIERLLDIWNSYIGWSDEDYSAMLEEHNLAGIATAEIEKALARREEERERREAAVQQREWQEVGHARNELLSSGVTMTAGGSDITFVLRPDGRLWGWGNNESGLIGDGTRTIRASERDEFGFWEFIEDNQRHTPMLIMENVAYISANQHGFNRGHVMAITIEGTLWGWGTNEQGQLGDGTTTEQLFPIKIMDNVSSVSVGVSHTMAITTDGGLWAWGANDYGQLGDSTTTNRLSPVRIMDNVSSVSAGFTHTMAITNDGARWGWGADYLIGDSTSIDIENWWDDVDFVTAPVKIMDNVSSVSTGTLHTMAITNDGALWGWGTNWFGTLGDGTEEHRFAPVKIMDDVLFVKVSRSGTMAVKSDGSLWGWGGGIFYRNSEEQPNHWYAVPVYRPAWIMDDVAAVFGAAHSSYIVARPDGSAVQLQWLLPWDESME